MNSFAALTASGIFSTIHIYLFKIVLESLGVITVAILTACSVLIKKCDGLHFKIICLKHMQHYQKQLDPFKKCTFA